MVDALTKPHMEHTDSTGTFTTDSGNEYEPIKELDEFDEPISEEVKTDFQKGITNEKFMDVTGIVFLLLGFLSTLAITAYAFVYNAEGRFMRLSEVRDLVFPEKGYKLSENLIIGRWILVKVTLTAGIIISMAIIWGVADHLIQSSMCFVSLGINVWFVTPIVLIDAALFAGWMISRDVITNAVGRWFNGLFSLITVVALLILHLVGLFYWFRTKRLRMAGIVSNAAHKTLNSRIQTVNGNIRMRWPAVGVVLAFTYVATAVSAWSGFMALILAGRFSVSHSMLDAIFIVFMLFFAIWIAGVARSIVRSWSVFALGWSFLVKHNPNRAVNPSSYGLRMALSRSLGLACTDSLVRTVFELGIQSIVLVLVTRGGRLGLGPEILDVLLFSLVLHHIFNTLPIYANSQDRHYACSILWTKSYWRRGELLIPPKQIRDAFATYGTDPIMHFLSISTLLITLLGVALGSVFSQLIHDSKNLSGFFSGRWDSSIACALIGGYIGMYIASIPTELYRSASSVVYTSYLSYPTILHHNERDLYMAIQNEIEPPY